MPITNITIENFKGISDRVEIPIRPITLLFGANSAGKSTILQALLYLRELLERENADADRLMASGAAIDLGGFRQFVHGHEIQRKVRIGVDLAVDADGLPVHFNRSADTATDKVLAQAGLLTGIETAGAVLTVEWDHETERPWITAYEVRVNGSGIARISSAPGFTAEITWFNYDHAIFKQEDTDEASELNLAELIASVFIGFEVNGFFTPDLKVPLRTGVLPVWGREFPLLIDEEVVVDLRDLGIVRLILSQFFVGVGELVLGELRLIRHIGSFRDIPERRFNVRRSPASDRWANGAAAWDLLYNTDLEWFDRQSFESLGLGYRVDRQSYYEIPTDSAIGAFLIQSQRDEEIYLSELESLSIRREVENLEELQRVRLIDTARSIEVDPCDVGVGVSQVIPVVVGAMAPGYSILSVEQPELHIHPAVQCSLADVLAKAVIPSERCLLLETHSEHLMLRWLRRIREVHEDELPPGAPAIRPEYVAVLYVETGEKGQKITELPITEDGDFAKKWPKGFFEERADELF